MPQRRLTLFAFASLLLPAAPPPRSGDLGREWIARDWTPNYSLSGKWIRRGQSALFDAYYKDSKGVPFNWTLEITSVSATSLKGVATMNIGATPKKFPISGVISADGRTIRGKGAWCRPGVFCGFEVKADWQVASSAAPRPLSTSSPAAPAAPSATSPLRTSPGILWKVRDRTTPGFDYSGTWTFDQGKIHFKYKGRDGSPAEGVLWLRAFTGASIRIYNSGTRRYYDGTISADGRTVTGTATGCPPRASCVWEATIEK